jgi:hypothetical protein
MDMKKILQAMDGISTKPVEGSNDMSKFLRVVREADLNQPTTETTWAKVIPNASGSYDVVDFEGNKLGTNLSQADATEQAKIADEQYKKIAPEFSSSIQVQNESLNEGANPHKVALPVQMAMQHYQQPTVKSAPRTRLIDKYFVEAEEAILKQKQEKRNLINQYASTIAERVLMKESGEAGWGRVGMAGVGLQPIDEMPIDMTGDPNDPTIYGHEKANPMSLKGRIMSARAQLKELAELAESNELVVWEKITRLSKGGMFMGLEQNLEQIRHGISELAAKRKQGGVASRGIDKNIGEDNDPCWDSHKMVGTKKKGGKTVPNCVPKE